MAKKSSFKPISFILILAGIGLFFWGFQMSDSVTSQFSRAFTGSDTDKVMMFYIGGIASFVIGLYLLFKK